MKLSFLIPSKDRLDLLKLAVASIREQRGLDYEIVIVDNCSHEGYDSYVAGLNDPRVVYKRQAAPVSVTRNWQDALELATGDYVLMLGDDDALAPNFTAEVTEHLTQTTPDVIYVAAYHYCYPNVIPGQDAGYLASVLNSEFLHPDGEPFLLDRGYAAELAASVLDFRHRFGLNAQHYLLKASFVAWFAAQGGLYRSPYPDTYSSVAIFLHAESILVIPRELVIIGISPKSFGAYYFSGRHDEGYVFLDNFDVTPEIRDSLEPVILPGDRNDTNWLIAAEAVRQAFPDRLCRRINIERYRTLQMLAVLRSASEHAEPSAALDDLRSRLSPSESMNFAALEAAVRAATEVGPDARNRMLSAMRDALGQYHPAKVAFVEIGSHETVADAINALRVVPPLAPDAPTSSSHNMDSTVSAEAQHQSPAARHQGPIMSTEQLPVRPWLVVFRAGQVFTLAVEDIDRFPFEDGDELSIEPAYLSNRWFRTPDQDPHIPVAPGVGVRVPPIMNIVEFKGYRIPKHLVRLTGAGIETFERLGRAHLVNYGQVMPLHSDMTFLEIGSGAGRDAFQLAEVIGPEGRYYAIDVQRESIVWCQNNITRNHPNFTFHHFNAEHELHNPLATKTTLDFPLPAPDGSVDFVALGSVFTHLFEDEVRYYLKEIARVLKPGGLCYATFFLYKDEVVEASRRNNLTPYSLTFEYEHGDGCYISNPQYPTGSVAFTEEKMSAMIRDAGLVLDRPYIMGEWSGFYPVQEIRDGQDVAVLRRADSPPPSGTKISGNIKSAVVSESPIQSTTPGSLTVAELQAENASLRALMGQQKAVARLARLAENRFVSPPLSDEQRGLVNRFVDFAYNIADNNGMRTYSSSWMGYEMLKWPTDLWSYQEIILRVRPEVIIETGTFRGGSALFLASICDLLDHGEVLSIDVDTSLIPHRPQHPRITYFDGSSTASSNVNAIARAVGGRKAVVILDSDHRRDHVLEELQIYEKFVSIGSYIVVEDTVVNGHPVYPEFGPGPWEAVEEFLQSNKNFTVDQSFERVYLTQNRRGYLFRHA